MKRTSEYVKVPNGTMFFPKVYLTKDEITNLYVYGHVRPSWFKLVLVDDSELDEIIALNKPLRASKSEAYNQLVALSNARYDEMRADLERFANGSLDLMDLSVKYWTYFKDTRKLFKDVLSDIGSGLNDNRRKLQKLLSMVQNGEVNRIFISNKNRLTQFGFNYIKRICDFHDVQIIIVSEEVDHKSDSEELADDIIALIHSFSGKLYGLRHKIKESIDD